MSKERKLLRRLIEVDEESHVGLYDRAEFDSDVYEGKSVDIVWASDKLKSC